MDAGTQEEIAAIRRRADRNAHGHIAHALRLKLADDVATFVATIGGAAVVAASCFLLGTTEPDHRLEGLIAVVGGGITLVGVWQAVWQPGQRARLHKQWANDFTNIEDECRLVLCGQSLQTAADLMVMLQEVNKAADLVAERHWRKDRKAPQGAVREWGRGP